MRCAKKTKTVDHKSVVDGRSNRIEPIFSVEFLCENVPVEFPSLLACLEFSIEFAIWIDVCVCVSHNENGLPNGS